MHTDDIVCCGSSLHTLLVIIGKKVTFCKFLLAEGIKHLLTYNGLLLYFQKPRNVLPCFYSLNLLLTHQWNAFVSATHTQKFKKY